MNKKIVRMTESDLRNIVKESVGKIINEIGDTPRRMLKEWDDDYPITVDDDDNVYYGNYYYRTNDFKRAGQRFWVLTDNGTPEYIFISPEEAAQYVAAAIQDKDIEADINEEEIVNEIMQSSDELGWYYKNYECTPTDVVKKRQ